MHMSQSTRLKSHMREHNCTHANLHMYTHTYTHTHTQRQLLDEMAVLQELLASQAHALSNTEARLAAPGQSHSHCQT